MPSKLFEVPDRRILIDGRRAKRAAGGPAIDAPYDRLAVQIGEAAYKFTEDQVANVVRQPGNEEAAFELMAAAAVGAGLYRWIRGWQH